MLRGSGAVVVSEDGQRVRRAQPLTSVEDMARAVDARSLYAGAPARFSHLVGVPPPCACSWCDKTERTCDLWRCPSVVTHTLPCIYR